MRTKQAASQETSAAKNYQGILQAAQYYLDGGRTGDSQLMRRGFSAPDIEPRIASIAVAETVATVRLEVSNWSGKLAGQSVRMSDFFTLLKTDDGWKITEKTFHWHSA